MNYLAVLGRQPEISLAELQALFPNASLITPNLAIFTEVQDSLSNECSIIASENLISRLGGTIKLAVKLNDNPINILQDLPAGKITIGISDYSKTTSAKKAKAEALKLKKILIRHGRSVRIVENKEAILSTATSLYNGLSGKNERKIEFIKHNNDWYKVIGVQDIDAYTKRDQARPARDAKVGMLPPKLAQILINLCGPLPTDSTILDPFCGTGVVLQEALLMGYRAYGTDISERMVEYTQKNLEWLGKKHFQISQGDATSFKWAQPINAIACEGYLGKPFAKIPEIITLKEQKQICSEIILGFLQNLSNQVSPKTPITIAIPAWLRTDNAYERLEILDEITKLGYNVDNKTREGLLYYRKGQIVARDILILRKK